MPTLFVLGGPQIGRSFEIAGEALLGRSPECDVPLAAPSISRKHARLVREDEAWVVHDLGSRNGLFSGELRVKRLELDDGDVFRLGDVELRFRLASSAELAAGPAPEPPPLRDPLPPVSAPPPAAPAPAPPPAASFDVDEIVLEDEPHEPHVNSEPAPTAPPSRPPAAAPRPAPPAAPGSAPGPASGPPTTPRMAPSASAAPARTGGPARRGVSTGPDVRQRDERPMLQYSRIEDRGGLLTSDLSQYPFWLRLCALLAALALFVALFLFAFRGTSLLKGKLAGGAAESELEGPR